MTIVVARRDTGEPFVVLGAGFARWQRAHNHPVWGKWQPVEESETYSLLALCDSEGRVGWMPSEQLIVRSIDGHPPGEIMGRTPQAPMVSFTESGKDYVLLGTGFAAFGDARPGLFFGNLNPDKSSGTAALLACCDADGNIGWLQPDKVRVSRIGGAHPSQALSGSGSYR